MVRAKFVVFSKTESSPGGLFSIKMTPVMEGSPENKEFFKYTPGGELTMATINAAAAEQFEVGKSYYLDFTPAE